MSVKYKITRRNFLQRSAKTTAGLIFGAGISTYAVKRGSILQSSPNDTIGLGIIGVGIRGKQLLSAIGLLHPEELKRRSQMAEDDSDVSEKVVFPKLELRGISDIYKGSLKYGMEVAEAGGSRATEYEDYRKMLDNKDIDAVIIATPDHWHATMGIDAVNSGKDIYIEKCMTHTIQEAKELVKAVKANKRVLQLGHQGRQGETVKKAKEYVENDTFGNITLVQAFTNKNTANDAWQYPIPKDATEETVNWERFLGKAPTRKFDLNRVFRWRCFWDYGTGISGFYFTDEWDAINYIMGIGIPHSAIASGGIYYWKDGREVPDVFQVTLEYPERNLSVTYNATLSAFQNRGQLYYGTDARMDLSRNINVFVDKYSKKYQQKVRYGELRFLNPILAYQPEIEAVTAATEKWTIDTGLLYSFIPAGPPVDPVMLHLKNFFDCMRSRKITDCNEDIGFCEAITAHMATQSYLKGRKIVWDPIKEDII